MVVNEWDFPSDEVIDSKTIMAGFKKMSRINGGPAGNIHSEFGHARPSGFRVIRYVRDGRTDKSKAYCPLSYGRGIKTAKLLIGKQASNFIRQNNENIQIYC